MATAAKADEGGSPLIAVLLLLVALAMAAGGGLEGLSGLGDSEGGNSTSTKDPCPPGSKSSKVVKSWPVGDKRIRLRCGDHQEGLRHIRQKRIKDIKVLRDALNCIGRTLRENPTPDGSIDVYDYRYAGKSGARVLVHRSTGDITNAMLVRGAKWSECAAGRRLR